MDALLCDLNRAGPPQATPVAPPAAVRLVTGKGLPEMPPDAEPSPAAQKTGLTPKRNFMAALRPVQQLKEEEE